jgi:deoxyribonuclease-4
MTLIGAHTDPTRPLQEATDRGADLVQIFLSDPQGWKKPKPRDDAEELRRADLPIYVHAPYLMNVASPNNRIRIPSRKNLAQAAEAADAIGAAGVIVHGGHVGDDEDVAVGYERWRKALESFTSTVPVLIENTAGGGNAVVRELEHYGPLWEEIGDHNVGVCLDSCHTWAGGGDVAGSVEMVRELTGRIDLLHCNDSRDPHDSRRDRHANLGDGHIPPEQLVDFVASGNAPVVLETPGGVAEHVADLEWLRSRL